jgi:ABC-type sugar transport system permease subunit
MSAATAEMRGEGRALPGVDVWVIVLTAWHVLLALAGIGAIIYFWSGGNSDMASWVRWLLTGVTALFAVGSAFAAPLVWRRNRRGRILSLIINYLLFIGALVLLLTLLNVFIGMDGLADTFGRGVPFLLVIFAGYLVGSFAERAEGDPGRQRAFRTAGKVIALAGVVGFLLAVDVLAGLGSALANITTSPWPAVLLAFLAVLGVMLWAMWRQPMADLYRATITDGETLNGLLFLSPNLLGFLLFFAGPLLLSLYTSFTNWDSFGTRDWVGLDNYRSLFNLTVAQLENPDQLAREVIDVTVYDELSRFTLGGRTFVVGAQDKLFWIALGNTLKYVLLLLPLAVIPALFLANLLNSKIRGMTFFRAAYFIPSVAAVVGIALVWQWLYNSSVGHINYFITWTVNALNSLGFNFTDPSIRWLSDGSYALLSVIIMAAWQLIGFNTVLFLAGLQNIPNELYEAATVDGAGPWAKFWRVTLPLLAPTTFFVLTTNVIRAMQVFEEVFILIPSNPAGPNNTTLTIALYLYQKGFQRFEQGYSAAIAWVLFLLIFGATLFQFQRQRRSENA